jgi:glycosyltransferase involved in cell wall biosynthesis
MAPASGDVLDGKRILFAPHEIGGQMQLMVEELRRRGMHATAATYNQEWFGHVNDINLDLKELGSGWRKQARVAMFALWAGTAFDIFHFFWGQSLFGTGRFPHADLRLLRRMGKKVFVHFRGLDIVDLAYFDFLRARTAGDDVAEPPLTRPDQARSVELWRRHAHKLLVSEPDLFRVVPEAEMVQQAVDLTHWQPSGDPPRSAEDGVIRIAHAPSMRRKKGTEFVERSIAELKDEGHDVELVLIEKVPFHEVQGLYDMCDIGIDQVLYGWYGKVSIELMALRKPVVCYIDPEFFGYRSDMPIVNGHPRDLTAVLRRLVEDAEVRRSLGDQGRAYVEKYHDVRSIIDQCLDIYRSAY